MPPPPHDQVPLPPWTTPHLHEIGDAPPVPEKLGDQLREDMKFSFEPPPETYGHKVMDVSDQGWRARVDLAAAYRLCVHFDLSEGIVNHLTAWVPEEEVMLVHPFGMGWDEVTASNLVALDRDGTIVRGRGNPEASAYFIHMRLHLNRKAPTGAVLHTHMPYATSLCLLDYPKLPMIHQTSLRFWNEIAYDPGQTLHVVTSEDGDRLAALMGEKKVLMQSNHGVTVAAESVALAFDYLFYLERSAKLLYLARGHGLPLREVDSVADGFKEMIDSVPHWAKMHFEANKRMLLRNPMHRDFMK